jgi:hypothetical protein
MLMGEGGVLVYCFVLSRNMGVVPPCVPGKGVVKSSDGETDSKRGIGKYGCDHAAVVCVDTVCITSHCTKHQVCPSS